MGYRSIVWALALIALLAAPAADAWANGAAGGAGSCLVDNPGGGAVAVRGAASVLVHDAYEIDTNNGNILQINFGSVTTDFTLVLEKGSVAATFRTRLVTPVVGLDNENLACRLLNPADTSQSDVVAAVTALVEHIRTTFGVRLRDFGLACLSAALLVLAFPKFDLGALAWVALVPLLVALEGKSPRAAYALSYLTGLLSFFGICYWIWAVPGWNLIDGFLIGVLYLPQYVALWGLGLAWLRRLTGVSPALVAPPLWVTLEYLRSNVPLLAFPWMLLGHSQHAYPSLIQISSVTGAYGLGFLIVLVNTAVAGIVLHLLRRSSAPAAGPRRFPFAAPVAAAALLAATLLYGQAVLLSATPAEEATIALVQGNIPQNP